jgi:hypothetical protein
MRIRILVLLAVLVGGLGFLLLLFTGRADLPGLRWRVKTFRDPDRRRVVLEPVDTTVAELSRISRPPESELRGSSRVAPYELSVYRVEAILRRLLDGTDGDIHLILADPEEPSRTMIAEIPLPFFSLGSGFENTFARERAVVRGRPLGRGRRVEVTGVGFFDSDTHDRPGGPKTNGFELHPVIAVKFLGGPPAAPPRPY